MTQPTSNQRDWASPPTFKPLPYRLLDAAEVVDFTGHQKLGVTFTPEYCGPALVTDAVCVTGEGTPITPLEGGIPTRAGDPFLIRAWIDCSLIGTGEEELRRRTLEALERNGPTTVETVFWTGGPYGVSPHLAEDTAITITSGGSTVSLQTAATVITGTYDVVEGLGLLEEAMAGCYGGVPFIHVPRRASAHLAANHLVESEDGRMYTANGSTVVPGAGYARTGPDGAEAPAGQAWFYATGAVKIWRGAVEFTAHDAAELLGRSDNSTVLVAQQRYVIGWDCCHFAILISLGGIITGAVNSAS